MDKNFRIFITIIKFPAAHPIILAGSDFFSHRINRPVGVFSDQDHLNRSWFRSSSGV